MTASELECLVCVRIFECVESASVDVSINQVSSSECTMTVMDLNVH